MKIGSDSRCAKAMRLPSMGTVAKVSSRIAAIGVALCLTPLLLACSEAGDRSTPADARASAAEGPLPIDAQASTAGPSGSAGAGAALERDLDFRGHRLHLLVAGPPSASISVLLLHGARYDSETWRKLGTLALLAERGLRVVAIDLPGFGRSESSDLREGELLAALLPVLAREVGLVRPVVIAPSMSGRVVFPYLEAERSRASMTRTGSDPKEGELARTKELRIAALVALAPVGIPQFERALADLRLPTLIVWGSEDRVVPVALAERMNSLVAGSRLEILEGAGHASYLERPDAFHSALLTFLDALTRERRL